jgi:chromosome partitioning protein
VDTPPGDLGIIRSAILASAIILVPVSPSGLDLNRIKPTFEVLRSPRGTQEDEPVKNVIRALQLRRE